MNYITLSFIKELKDFITGGNLLQRCLWLWGDHTSSLLFLHVWVAVMFCFSEWWRLDAGVKVEVGVLLCQCRSRSIFRLMKERWCLAFQNNVTYGPKQFLRKCLSISEEPYWAGISLEKICGLLKIIFLLRQAEGQLGLPRPWVLWDQSREISATVLCPWWLQAVLVRTEAQTQPQCHWDKWWASDHTLHTQPQCRWDKFRSHSAAGTNEGRQATRHTRSHSAAGTNEGCQATCRTRNHSAAGTNFTATVPLGQMTGFRLRAARWQPSGYRSYLNYWEHKSWIPQESQPPAQFPKELAHLEGVPCSLEGTFFSAHHQHYPDPVVISVTAHFTS